MAKKVSKKKTGKKKKPEKLKEGDTVFYTLAISFCAMVLIKIITKEKIEYGKCIWSKQNMEEGKLINRDFVDEFPLSLLTKTPTPQPTNIMKG